MFDSKYTGQQIEEMLEQAGNDLVTAGEDESYVVKVVDAEGTVLAGFKESGEIAVPIGLTDDAYTLIKALYDKLSDVFPTIKSYCENTYETADERKALIDTDEDESYVAKLIDADGSLLQGFKLNGEVEVPKGLTDDAYSLVEALYKKMVDMAAIIAEIKESISN